MLQLQVWIGHSCPTLLTLGWKLSLVLMLQLQVWVGHSCPTLLTLTLGLILQNGPVHIERINSKCKPNLNPKTVG
jgi:hypothetical protein